MKLAILFAVFMSVALQKTLGSYLDQETLAERHTIVKRLADDGQVFTEHDVAIVLHEKAPYSFHPISKRDLRQVTDDHSTQRVRLELSTGSKMHLKLQKRSLFHPDTLFLDNTHDGLVKRATPLQDCYATGEMEADGLPVGHFSLAMCNGLHGTATVDDVEYYIHPVDHIEGEHKVHVLSRRAVENETIPEIMSINMSPSPEEIVDRDTHENKTFPEVVTSDAIPSPEEPLNRYKRTVTRETYKTATKIVIEMAVFIDAKYWIRLQKIAPGREDEYVLIAMAATNALFSNPEKVGYDASIKIKLYQNWVVDPDGYNFQESIGNNLHSFCKYTRKLYNYDMHFLFTGVTRQQGPAVGVAYMSSICTDFKCGNTYSTSYSRFSLIAHEIGHNIGFNHHGAAKCPQEIKSQGGGFMGGGDLRNFSPCNKWELYDFFSKGKGQCLFEETRETTTGNQYVNLQKVLPGQYFNPDEGCRFQSGEDYKLFRPFDFRGSGECAAWMCINTNKESPEYLRIKRKYALVGYTCDDEMFCDGTTCSSWEKPGIGWNPARFRAMKIENHWSEWSEEWSPCSHTCGKGVQIKKRQCIFSSGPFLSPYCRGSPFQVRLCNVDPCPGKAIAIGTQRQTSGDEICERFYGNNVTLHVPKDTIYLNKSRAIDVRDRANKYFETRSCMLQCTRRPSRLNYIDSIYPDGTPCTESKISFHKRQRFNIDLRCVQGACTEISDCPGTEKKDVCGVCGGDPVNCVDIQLSKTDDVPKGERKVIAQLPAGTKAIDINMRWWENRGVRMELWNTQGEKVIGSGGRFPKTHYRGTDLASVAGTSWSYDHGQYVRADGPTDQDLVVKVLRQANPIKRIWVTYLLPGTA